MYNLSIEKKYTEYIEINKSGMYSIDISICGLVKNIIKNNMYFDWNRLNSTNSLMAQRMRMPP